MHFAPPIAHVYDPLRYAWAPYEAYVARYGASRKRVNQASFSANEGELTDFPFGTYTEKILTPEIVAAMARLLASAGSPRKPIAISFMGSRDKIATPL